jgi:hypothetical protein
LFWLKVELTQQRHETGIESTESYKLYIAANQSMDAEICENWQMPRNVSSVVEHRNNEDTTGEVERL